MRETHGLSKHPLYAIWQGIKTRIYNSNSDNYFRYGGRGLDMDELWRESFTAFYDWCISCGWERGLVIHRVDNDRGYHPDNCAIVTQAVNVREGKVAKTDMETARLVRKLLKSGVKRKQICDSLGLSEVQVSSIVLNKIWREG